MKITQNSMILLVVALILVGSLMVAFRFLGGGGGLDHAVTRPISDGFSLGTDWVTFSADPVLNIDRQSAKVLLSIPNVKDVRFDSGTVLLSDGTECHIEAVLTGVDGREYQLRPISMGESVGFGFSDQDAASLRSDVAFSSLRMRSDVPVRIDRVSWYTWTGK